MSEALQLVVRFSFRSLEVNRLEALVIKENIPSVRFLEKLGFQLEGTLRQYALIKGLFQDMQCYSMLKDDYDHQP
jgi:RimJ/RimL family protein N-acetyltransferase